MSELDFNWVGDSLLGVHQNGGTLKSDVEADNVAIPPGIDPDYENGFSDWQADQIAKWREEHE